MREKMAEAGEACVIHYEGLTSETLIKLSNKRIETIKECAEGWIKSSKEPERTIGLNVSQLDLQTEMLFHQQCYSRFANKGKVARALTSKKHKPSGSQQIGSPTTNSQQSDSGEPPIKFLRSSVPVKTGGLVLPNICIICGKKEKFYSKRGKTCKDTLMQAETLTAGKLIDAAKANKDETILKHIRGTDAVAIEMKYHHVCYLNYTRCIYKTINETLVEREPTPEDEIYKQFCHERIEKCIIEQKSGYHMSSLLQDFKRYACHASADVQLAVQNYSNAKLKYRLRRDYPQLKFDQPKNKAISEFVYVNHANWSDLMDTTPLLSYSSSATTSEHSSPFRPTLHTTNTDVELYHTGRHINKLLNDHPPSNLPWPPSPADLTMENAEACIPPALYNLMSLIIGTTSEPSSSNQQFTADVPNHLHEKLLSLCQDIVYLQSHGNNATPKSLALGMTIRHMTGSSDLQTLISRFGHCSSYTTISRYMTGLALKRLQDPTKIPPGFSKKTLTMIVWDNIDFGEETPTGSGTTHHTNGIMVQKKVSSEEHPLSMHTISKRVRSLRPVPTEMLPYHRSVRQGPHNITESAITAHGSEQLHNLLEFSYLALKTNYNNENRQLPTWNVFHRCQNRTALPKSTIHYMPVIEAASTDFSTIHHVLTTSIDMANNLEVEMILLVFDQAIYAKAQEIRWGDPDIRRRTVLRLGEFHTCMSFLSAIGKRFLKSGLEDVLVDAEVVAPGSMNGVLSGHMYNRSIRAHKLLYEALGRLQIAAFLESCEDKDRIVELINEECKRTADSQPISMSLEKVYTAFEEHVQAQCVSNPTYAFWNSYMTMVRTLLQFIKATRESDWLAHLASLHQMLPWFFAYDRINYARYAPAYWSEMNQLKETHPMFYSSLLEKGSWTVQRQENHAFNGIAADQAIEQTVNRECKTSGGLKGITLDRGAVQRWILTQSDRAAISSQCESLVGWDREGRTPKDSDQTKMAAEERAVRSILATVEAMVNPWDGSDSLINLSSGAVASDVVAKDLLEAHQLGEAALKRFLETLIANPAKMFESLKSMKLKTFSNLNLPKKSKAKAQSALAKQDKGIFARLLMVSQTRNLDMKAILEYSLSSVSLPLAGADGSMNKTNKALLLAAFETENHLATTNLSKSALMIDAMALVQELPATAIPATFGELATFILRKLSSLAAHFNSERVDFVGDRYPLNSIKNSERNRRGQADSTVIAIYSATQRCPPQWKKFLSGGRNKEALLAFLVDHWQTEKLQDDLTIYATYADECRVLQFANNSPPLVSSVEELTSDHEEADTRLLLHAKHAAQNHPQIVVRSPDTDVAIICIGFAHLFEELYFATGVKGRRRLISINKVRQSLMEIHEKLPPAMIGLHALTGCDSTSGFYGKGKRGAFLCCKTDSSLLQTLKEVGESFDVTDSLLKQVELLVCKLYGSPKSTGVNAARFTLFCSRSGNEQSIPPTKDALLQHVRRANYQAAIWKRSDRSFIAAPSPTDNGWHIDDGELDVLWTTAPIAPPEVLQLVKCGCSKTACSSSSRCSCRKLNLKCTDLCACSSCKNAEAEDDCPIADSDDGDDFY